MLGWRPMRSSPPGGLNVDSPPTPDPVEEEKLGSSLGICRQTRGTSQNRFRPVTRGDRHPRGGRRRGRRNVAALSQCSHMRLIVVRHGIATAKRRWDGPDAARPLTASGARQATAVAARLARYHLAEIISSPSLRCRQTVEPLSELAATSIQSSEQLGVDAGARALELIHQLVTDRPSASTIVVCTHREVLVETLPALAAEFGVTPDHRPPGAKGSFWMLRFRGDHLVNIKYSRPNW